MSMNLETVIKPVREIKTYARNAKIHTSQQINEIKSSIKQFGFNDPIAVDENGEIIEGHGRLIAALELGYKELPVIVLDHLSESQKKAYALIHNKLTMDTGFDMAVLEDELRRLMEVDMSAYFDTSESSSYFEDDPVMPVSDKITVISEGEAAIELRYYLKSNKYKYKEKPC